MATIFVTNPATVVEIATSPIFINISKRLGDKGDTFFEVKVSALMDTTPVIAIVTTKQLPQFSQKELEAKKECEAVEAKLREELEAAGYTVLQGTASEGNSQRFTVPAAEVIDSEGKLKKPIKKKATK